MINPIKIKASISKNPIVSLKTIGQALSEKLSVKSKDPLIKEILERISDLSAFKNLNGIPKCRIKGGWAKAGDFQFQNEIQKLINNSIITPKTIVIADTGHDIPMLAQLHKNDNLKFTSAFQFKFLKENAPNISRISEQTVTWGEEISRAESKITSTNGLYIGLEAHRNWKINTNQMPSIKEIQNLGIKKIVYLGEASPKANLSAKNTGDLKDYFKNLEKNGIEVHYKGVDPRYDNSIRGGDLRFRAFIDYLPNGNKW